MTDFKLVKSFDFQPDTSNSNRKKSKRKYIFQIQYSRPFIYAFRELSILHSPYYKMNTIKFGLEYVHSLPFINSMNDGFTVDLHTLKVTMNISPRHTRRSRFRNCDNYYLGDGKTLEYNKNYSTYYYTITVADIIKLYYFKTKSNKKQPYAKLFKKTLKFNNQNQHATVLGLMVGSTIVKINGITNNINGLDAVLSSMVVLTGSMHSELYNGFDEKSLEDVGDVILGATSEGIVSMIFKYIYHNEPLFNYEANVIHFDEPITMAELRKMLEKTDRDRHFFCKIFQPLNRVKREELETYGEIQFNHRKFTDENIPQSYPVWAYRKFTFTSVNMDRVMYFIKDAVEDAIRRGSTRKRHRNKKKHYFLNVGETKWWLSGTWEGGWKDKNEGHKRRKELRNQIKEELKY